MASTPSRQAEYLSLRDAAAIYGVSVDTLRDRIAYGELPAVRAGRRIIRVRAEDVMRIFRPVIASQPR